MQDFSHQQYIECFVAKVVTTLRAIHCGYRPLSQFNRSISSIPINIIILPCIWLSFAQTQITLQPKLCTIFAFRTLLEIREVKAMRAEGAARHAMPKGRPVGSRALKNPGQDFDTPRYHRHPCNLQWNRKVGVRFSRVGFLIEKYGKDIIPSINQVVLFPEVKRWNIEEMAHTCTMKATWYSSYIITYHAINRWVVILGLCKCCTTS